ncbi:hypothetical protein [uncultured Desulfovibrio sp.]|uniref:hypothetical protein n=1 Tax=uncultured Desulfovibrio sp. TaxID=167968 RepID=UPI00261FF9E7|nr:hypothetical protein [uncultured Desulfovibrio sp.]
MPYLPQFLKKKLTTMPEPALRRLAYVATRIALFSFASLPFLMGCIFYMVRPDIPEILLRVFFAAMLVGIFLGAFMELMKITESSSREELMECLLFSIILFSPCLLLVCQIVILFFQTNHSQ